MYFYLTITTTIIGWHHQYRFVQSNYETVDFFLSVLLQEALVSKIQKRVSNTDIVLNEHVTEWLVMV
jgi:hypothetical protein